MGRPLVDSSLVYLGIMRRADVGQVWADHEKNAEVARAIFGLSPTSRLVFYGTSSFWWTMLEQLWPAANFVYVWEDLRA